MRHALHHVHFVGIGGSGMSGLAEVLHAQGFVVSGSDLAGGETVERLRTLGVRVALGHDAAHVAGADAVVVSTAVPADNPEVAAARVAGVPVVPRAVLLAELMRTRQGIAVAGTHGKTTTTSLVASVLMEAGLDPGFVIGGRLHSAGANAHAGRGEFFVAEADESDASFLHLGPVIAVVTNIDEDHMETYAHSRERLDQAFLDFLHRLPFYGTAVVCSDDPGVQRILPRLACRVVRYGLDDGADLRAVDVQALPGGAMQFAVPHPSGRRRAFTLPLPGRHSVRNALAAIAVAGLVGVDDDATARALRGFAGVGRRFQRHGALALPGGGHATLIDDYGHHPVEMAAVLDAARGAFPGQRLLLAFQPHRYTRTRDCFEGFVDVLARFDEVLLAEVYAAGEAPIAGATAQALAQAVGARVSWVGDVQALPAAILAAARDGDVVVTMGAGSIGRVPARLAAGEGVQA